MGYFTDRISIYRTLIANSSQRNPVFSPIVGVNTVHQYEYVNCYGFNLGSFGLTTSGRDSSAPIQLNIIGNQWHLPDNGSQSRRWIQLASQAGSSYYLSDDNFDSRYRVTEGRDVWDELTAIDGDFASNFSEPQSKIYQAPTAHPLPLISDGNIPLPGSQVWDALKNEFGASGFRDAADRRIIAEIESSQAPDWALGPLDENEFGTTYSPLNSLSEIPTDSDNDGIPDSFEARLGTDPMTADNNGDLDRDGYTNLEEYLNLLAR